MRRAARVDSNHGEIRSALRNLGAYVLDTFQLKNAFDLLVGYRGKIFIIEIKDGKKTPSQRKLTEGEEGCKAGFNNVGVPYNVVTSVDEAVELINPKA